MAESVLLRDEIPPVRRRRRNLERDSFGDPHTVRLELLDLRRIVRHQPHRLHAEHAEQACGALVRAEVGREPEDAVRVDRVEPVVLEVVRGDLVRDPDPASFLREVDQGAVRRRSDSLQGGIELGAAIAPLGSEHVARDALRVEANKNVLSPRDTTLDERDVLLPREGTLERMDAEGPVARREARRHGEEEVVAQLDALFRQGAVPMGRLYIRMRRPARASSRGLQVGHDESGSRTDRGRGFEYQSAIREVEVVAAQRIRVAVIEAPRTEAEH